MILSYRWENQPSATSDSQALKETINDCLLFVVGYNKSYNNNGHNGCF